MISLHLAYWQQIWKSLEVLFCLFRRICTIFVNCLRICTLFALCI
jgi:hypothetical protein